MAHITPGRNGWTENAGTVLRAIERKERGKMYAGKAEENAKAREKGGWCSPRLFLCHI